MENYKRLSWEDYKGKLEDFGYTQEQISAVKEIRETVEQISKEQFDFLVQTKVITRTRKLKKVRSLYVVEDKIFYLDHYEKAYRYCGYFKDEE